MTELSAHQRRVLRRLASAPTTAIALAAAVCVSRSGITALLQVLHQRGLVRYIGGAGVTVGKGSWVLTDRGRIVDAEET